MTVQMDPSAPQLLMLLVVGAVVVLPVWIAVRAVRGRPVGRLALILSATLVLYVGALLGAGVASRTADLKPGDLKCFDEWCAGMVGATPATGRPEVLVQARLENQGHSPQRSVLARAFIEAGGQRIWPSNPDAMQRVVPPGQEVNVTLNFDLPPQVEPARFVITEAASGTLTPGILVIGDESSPFHSISGWPLQR